LGAEKYLNDAFASLQRLIDEYPKIQNTNRFNELYRSVMTEYREFYGIAEPTDEVQGEIFAIREEIFNKSDELSSENYSLPSNIELEQTEVPLLQNRQVNRHLIYFTMKRPEVMSRWLQRSKKYFPMMREIFNEVGTPVELVHLSMIESGLRADAYSPAAASGMWQFIRATGSMYGLEVNWWIDERRDPVKATRAAARHLKDLYDIWNDWHLAMANYNVSPRRLKQAIRLGGGEEDYWSAYPYLPNETKGYIPAFIATTMIAQNPQAFGFKEEYDVEPFTYEVVQVEGLMPLDALAEAADISEEKLRQYNPELLRWATPPGGKYPLKIPGAQKEIFVENYKEIPKDRKENRIAMQRVSKGETLGEIANQYGTTVRGLYETNESLSSTIYPGQRIAVPLPAGSSGDINANRPSHQPRGKQTARKSSRQAPDGKAKLTYTVKSNDTIGHIAEWFDTHAWKIRSWNNTDNMIHVGERLAVYVPKDKLDFYSRIDNLSYSEKQDIEQKQRNGVDITEQQIASAESNSSDGNTVTYTVRRNDTLSEIASSFNVSVGEIKQWNNLRGSRIYVGQTLTIRR
jgi:membrane-bound lytic murein transglycosylase D